MPAILYTKNAYETDGPDLVGLQAANRHFLDALLRDEQIGELGCYVPDRQTFDAFRGLVEPATKKIVPILYGDRAGLARAQVLHLGHPVMGPQLWQRRYGDERQYSVTGVIHSISSDRIMDAIGALLLAPLQKWDALVCTSQAGRGAVTTILDNWAEYLARRLNATPEINIQLPVIPLGVDCAAFAGEEPSSPDRVRIRTQLGIGDDDVAVLFVGRLAFRRKCHPVPMYLALQRAQRATGARLHFIQAGRFEDAREDAAFRAAAAQFCPDVATHVIGGSEVFHDSGVWFAADIFLSLSDNIQETFGLAPVEAMAAGLPVVVSDWDGYRDTVRDGVDGFLVATTVPAAGAGLDLAARYHEFGNFRQYYGAVAMSTAVDIEACAEALARLIRDPDLRRRMGDSGRRRARASYDWPVVTNDYRRLWEALAAARRDAAQLAPAAGGRSPHPLRDDPYRVFAGYATSALGPDTAVTVDPGAGAVDPARLYDAALTRFGGEWRSDRAVIDAILRDVGRRAGMTLGEIAPPAAHRRRNCSARSPTC
jgi:glycosyltransferase involved in cell wall biosynthesis